MAEYFANVLARLIVSYLTLFVMSLAILAGYWIIEDYNAMVEFIKSISDNTFAHIVVWMPFVFSWFKPDKRGNATEMLNVRMYYSGISCSMSGKW
ncbi:hypothetical protein [Sulfurimonas xiamenensis]|uniref:Uncharacterized protein n=1 Tax=Sulfurimonas xiamenensis TaxID=2590021 RepID=A0AAJ4DM58_9BACT|nr:hypothetical protein [Sulfurimonas xiamenensis]QFR42817.1 hypothetical protein FJR47_02380 [Sulfurimonas xiamenensis]